MRRRRYIRRRGEAVCDRGAISRRWIVRKSPSVETSTAAVAHRYCEERSSLVSSRHGRRVRRRFVQLPPPDLGFPLSHFLVLIAADVFLGIEL